MCGQFWVARRRSHAPGPFRNVVNLYAQANLLQIMPCTACTALHDVTQRACRWLLQTRDRVDDDTFALKQKSWPFCSAFSVPPSPWSSGRSSATG
jgi:hypothetical protein